MFVFDGITDSRCYKVRFNASQDTISFSNSSSYWKVGFSKSTSMSLYSLTPKKSTVYIKGTTKYGNISTRASSMTNTSSYYYVKLGSDSIDVVNVSANKSQVISGESITVKVSPSKTITYGGTISYLYQYSKDGGSTWEDISTSTSTSIQFEVPTSNADYTLKFRVRSQDNMGFTSTDYILSQNIGVTINNPPSFNVSGSNLGTVSEPICIDYIVSDVENDDINVTESIDDVIIRTYKPVLGQSNTFQISGQKWNKLLNGVHKVAISATDINNSTSIQEWTFTKNIDSVELTLSTPLEAADIIHRTILNVERKVPEGAEFRVYACNNGFDNEPVWEEMTSAVLRGKKFFFSNATKTATKWGYNLKIILQRNNTQGDCYISGIGGNFE